MNIEHYQETYGAGWLQKFNKAKAKQAKIEAKESAAKSKVEEGPLYQVYYLPEENYCGVSKVLKSRLSCHRTNGKDTSNHIILFDTYDRKEAFRVEHQLQKDYGYGGYQSGNIDNLK